MTSNKFLSVLRSNFDGRMTVELFHYIFSREYIFHRALLLLIGNIIKRWIKCRIQFGSKILSTQSHSVSVDTMGYRNAFSVIYFLSLLCHLLTKKLNEMALIYWEKKLNEMPLIY